MPKRQDIKKIMLIGSGPIIIGQACEFDYSGVQACKALREEGYEIVLVNSNPATIMTDPEFADRTYIEPLTCDTLHAILERERPDALLPTLGGQTALNLAMELAETGLLEQFEIELIGADTKAIAKAEDRDLFKQAMHNIGLDLPTSRIVHTLEDAQVAKDELGDFPLIIRPAFTLGGSGGGIAYNADEYISIVTHGLNQSPISEVLVEESILGWKEFELEVMRDRFDNCVVVCSIENLDPMGVHTGDSITVAPAQTLTDREYQIMRDAAFAIMREIGVETGGSNVQFAVNPVDGRLVIIEMNPRVSRSSALASKATGFPIAKIAAKLAVGYTLDEIRNDITRETPASFEPTIDYVVTKIPRFTFEKFPSTDSTLGTQMKSVGETMSIGKTFKQSLQKGLRGLETGHSGFGADGKDGPYEQMSDTEVEAELRRPNCERLFVLRAALKRGWSIDRIYELTRIDRWFLRHLAELAAYEEEIRSAGDLDGLVADDTLFRQAKEFGYSDRQIAYLIDNDEDAVRAARKRMGLTPVYGLVDTCAAEFVAHTPYYYSSYGELDEARNSDRKKVMILGGGPNRIGQGIEFDYCCVHAAFALREAGFETIMVNSNPETVSTDYDTSDKLYFEPLTLEDVLSIYERENCWGVIPQFGGQTPLNLAKDLQRNGVNVIGTSPENIEAAEDRRFFQELAERLGIQQPPNDTATNTEEAVAIATRIGYPVLVRPSFVLGGRAMVIVYEQNQLQQYMHAAVQASAERPVLIDSYLEAAVEVDVDCISDGNLTVVGAIMEHVEEAGVHSGDSACVIPAPTLGAAVKDRIREYSQALAKELNVIGLMNIQYAVQDNEVYILEVNPRASRTIPFVSKAIGIPLAKYASLIMVGKTLPELGFTAEVTPPQVSVKEAVFPFIRFPGTDITLSPEMKSTGEVMGIDVSTGLAYLKSQLAAGNKLPRTGNIFLSVRDDDKESVLDGARRLQSMGFTIYATAGTGAYLRAQGVASVELEKISDGSPNVLDLVADRNLAWIVNTPASGVAPRVDEIRMRGESVIHGIPITTTVAGFLAAVSGLEALKGAERMDVRTIQEYHADLNG
ncbi:MAG: carbamoyl-phosphate synthase large subunit [Lentisphaeria bacterium]|jgi:carbamoyl-phosphate synthase large subunit|nr:carbamoyl-phosphate synthase large subunit [Lentisphaeria bacterium]